ncbi:MAG: hypothetical protein LBS11_00925 [Oscillospiraceae bacterium]|nr:hypothetical protein [Oscillospiraceae bacterium]
MKARTINDERRKSHKNEARNATVLMNELIEKPIEDVRRKEYEKQGDEYKRRAEAQYFACLVCLEWFETLRNELEKFADQWFEIVPKGFSGSVPRLTQHDIFWQDRLLDRATMQLQYTINHIRATKIIQSTGLYGQQTSSVGTRSVYNQQLVFIRELIQNTLDAAKIQLFRDLRNGLHGSPLSIFDNKLNNWRAGCNVGFR